MADADAFLVYELCSGRDQARRIAVTLEQENAELRQLLTTIHDEIAHYEHDGALDHGTWGWLCGVLDPDTALEGEPPGWHPEERQEPADA